MGGERLNAAFAFEGNVELLSLAREKGQWLLKKCFAQPCIGGADDWLAVGPKICRSRSCDSPWFVRLRMSFFRRAAPHIPGRLYLPTIRKVFKVGFNGVPWIF